MTSGITIKEIAREIQYIHTNEAQIVSIYGFGSFFRSNKANDCDLLFVIDNNCPDLGSIHAKLYRVFSELGDKLSITFDLTILTEREHEREPLLEHNALIPISMSNRNNA